MNVGVKVKPKTVSQARYDQMIQVELFLTNAAIQRTFGLVSPLLDAHQLKFSRAKICHRARCRIFKKLRDMDFSYPSIARVSGYHHASIIHGVNTAILEDGHAVTVTHNRKRAAIDASPGQLVPPAEQTRLTPDLHEPPMLISMPNVA